MAETQDKDKKNAVLSDRRASIEANQPLLQEVQANYENLSQGSFIGSTKEITEKISFKDLYNRAFKKKISEDIIRNKEKILPREFESVEQIRKVYREHKENKAKKIIPEHSSFENINHRNFMPLNNRNLCIASFDSINIVLYDIETKEELEILYDQSTSEESYVVGITVSLDDEFIAFACEPDNNIGILNMQTKECIFSERIFENETPILLAFTKNAEYVIASHPWGINLIKIVDPSSGKIVSELEVSKNVNVQDILMSSKNKIICSMMNASIKVFDFDTLKVDKHFENVHNRSITSIGVSPDGKHLIAGLEALIKVFSLENYEQISEIAISYDEAWIYSTKVSNDNRFLACGSKYGSILLLDLECGQELETIKATHSNAVFFTGFTSDNKFLVSISYDGFMKTHKIMEPHNPQRIVTGKEKCILNILFSADIQRCLITKDDRYLILAARRLLITIFDLKANRIEHEIQNYNNMVWYAITLSYKEEYLIFASNESEIYSIKVFDMSERRIIHTFENAHDNQIYSLAITKDNRFLYSVSRDKSLKKFDFLNKTQICHLQNLHEGLILFFPIVYDKIASINFVILSSKEEYLLTLSSDNSVKVLNTDNLSLVYHLKNVHTCIKKLKYDNFIFIATPGRVFLSSDDKLMVTCSLDNSIKLFDFETLKEINHFIDNRGLNYQGPAWCVTFCSDKYLIRTTTQAKSILYDIKAKKIVCSYSSEPKAETYDISLFSNEKEFVTLDSNGVIEKAILPYEDPTELYYCSSLLPVGLIFPRSDDFFLQPDKPHIRRKSMLNYQDLYILPHYWTILHILAINQSQTIPLIADYAEFKVPFLLDKYERTPLHYIVASSPIDYLAANTILNYICDYLEDQSRCSSFECQKVLDSMTSLFLFIVSKTKPNLAERYLRLCFQDSPTRYNEERPTFGQPAKKVTFSWTPVLLPEVKAKIYESGDESIQFKSVMIKLDYTARSDDMFNSCLVLSEIQEERIFNTPVIGHLIDYLWRKVRLTLNILAGLFSLLMILLSLYIGRGERSLILEISIMTLTTVLISAEMIQAASLGVGNYFKSFWNWVDNFNLFMIMAFVIRNIIEGEQGYDLTSSWLSSLIIIIGYTRWASCLRLFDPTRNLIQVILSILHDMLGFITIVALITLGFSVIFMRFSYQNPDIEGEEQIEDSYTNHIYQTYMVIFGNTDDTGFNASQKIILSLILFILNVLLLNMLISIMGNTFGRVQEMKALNDSLTRLDMILEGLVFIRIFDRRRCAGKGYLIFCGPDIVKESEETNLKKEGESITKHKSTVQMMKDFETKFGEVQLIQKSIYLMEKKVEDNFLTLRNEISDLKELMKQKLESKE